MLVAGSEDADAGDGPRGGPVADAQERRGAFAGVGFGVALDGAAEALSADGAYTDVVLANGRRRTLDRGLRATIRYLGRDDVLQVHKSYAVPVHAIAHVRPDAVTLRSGGEIPFGRTYRARVYAALRKQNAP